MKTISKVIIMSFFAGSLFLFTNMNCCYGPIDVLILFMGFVGISVFPPFMIWAYDRQLRFKEEYHATGK